MKSSLLALFLLTISLNSFSQLYTQDFESATFPPANCSLDPAGSPSWVRETGISAYGVGNGCMSFDNFTVTSGTYNFRIPGVNFSHIPFPYVRFDYAYATQPTTVNTDQMVIGWSPNGVTNWQQLQTYFGNSLVTALPIAGPFIPTANDWRTITFPLQFLVGQPSVKLQIQNISNNANKLYIDNIIVFDTATSGINDLQAEQAISFYPNPFAEEIFVTNFTQRSGNSVAIYTSLGKLIYQSELSELTTSIDLSSASGEIFFYTIANKDGIFKTGKILRSGK